LGGYRLPHRFLTEQGIVPAETFRDERFTFSYPAALVRLLEGWVDLAPCFVHRADPAALDEVLQLLLGADADRLAPLAFTEAVPNDGIVLGPQADPSWLRRLEEVATGPRGGELYDLLDVEALIAASTEDYAEEGLLGPYRSRRTSRGPL
jgi:ABC-type phosphate/phosphonate transport system substrate-binding protein